LFIFVDFGKSPLCSHAMPFTLIHLYAIVSREMVVDEHFEDRLKVDYVID